MTVTQYVERQLPYDYDAEAALLGAILIDAKAIALVSNFVAPEDFHRAPHRFIYEAAIELFISSLPVDQITVARKLTEQQRLDNSGGLPYIGHLIASTPTSVNADHYARIVQETAQKRRMIDAGNRIVELGFKPDLSSDQAISAALEHISLIARMRTQPGLRHLRDRLHQYHDPDREAASEPSDHIRTGFANLDHILPCFDPGDLIIVGAATSAGKTSLALGFTMAAAHQGHTVALFSLEMQQQQTKDIHKSIGQLSEMDIWTDDNASYTIADIASELNRINIIDQVDLAVIDYIQLIRPPGNHQYRNAVQAMTEVSRSLKELAITLRIPIIACSQLSRAHQSRPDHRPMLSDLRESGSIEQDADVVMLIYRPDRYFTRSQWAAIHPGSPYPRNYAELIVAKNRNGPIGSVDLYFNPNTMQFHPAQLHHVPQDD